MIFCIDNYTNPKEVTIYESISQLTMMVEWQDILDEEMTHIDQHGNIYGWDQTQSSEYATIYGYTMIVVRTDIALAEKCMKCYKRSGYQDDFILYLE